jgi:serine/threonine protein kinase
MSDASSKKSVSRSGTALQDEQRSRWQRGEHILVEELLREHPGIKNNSEALLELLYNEVLLREQDGESPTLAEYVERFPHLAGPLKDQFEVHQVLESTGALPSSTFAKNDKRIAPGPAGLVQDSASLLQAIRRHQLLEAEKLAGLESRFPDPKALAGELIRRGWLTPYQANQFLHNKGQELVLGAHILLERLGEGGMGQVFKARHKNLDRIVAIKLIRKERVENPGAVQRFQREIRAVAALSHPHIVRAFDADAIDGTHFLVMEYIEGATDLARLVKKEGALSAAQACDYIRQAALGLQHAFERGLVHRDIKPQNLLLAGPEKTIKILDMGLARLDEPAPGQDHSTTMTQEGVVMGTPDYIAPEQALDSHSADIRADLYSLGCTFYYLLAGRVPFPGGTFMEKINRHNFDDPTPLEQLHPGIPAGVSAIVRKLMAKKPQERFQIPGELAQALTALGNIKEGLTPSPGLLRGSADKRKKQAEEDTDAGRKDTFAAALSYMAKHDDFELLQDKNLWRRYQLPVFLAGSFFTLIGVVVIFLLANIGGGEGPAKKDDHPINPQPPKKRHLIDQAWLKQVADLSAEDKWNAVLAKLREKNPAFDGKATHAEDGGVITELQFFSDDVDDISPLRALDGLKKLECFGSNWGKGILEDLSPLEGLKLTALDCSGTRVDDLSPLKSMPLATLTCSGTPVKDLSPLAGMALTTLGLDGTQVSDLTPIKDLQVSTLRIAASKVTNLAPLKNMPLKELHCDFRPERDSAILRSIKTLRTINGKPRDEILK